MQELTLVDGEGAVGADCRCDGGQPKNFARPCFLLLLAEAPAHGYELMERLRPFGFAMNDPAGVYKSLRSMESDGLVASSWTRSRRGPPRRVYRLTSDGLDLLGAWAETLVQNRAIIDDFLGRFQKQRGALAGARAGGLV